VPSILWRGSSGSLERCALEQTAEGWRLAGTTLLTADGAPYEIRYSVLLDAGWGTRTVGAHVQGPGQDRRMALTSDGAGTWSVTDQPVLELFGATDVDLAWTPATNTVPIRRLGLAVGESGAVTAARVAFPEHDIARVTQHYERLSEHDYRYTSGDFSAELTVDEHGLVTRYGDLWSAAARS
jgi:hypothetical protein